MNFVKGVGFKPITSLPEDNIKAFPRSDAITASFSPQIILILNIENKGFKK
jgi:hypothetical protein